MALRGPITRSLGHTIQLRHTLLWSEVPGQWRVALTT